MSRFLILFLMFLNSLSLAFVVDEDIAGINLVETSSCYFYDNRQLFIYLSEEQAVFFVSRDNEAAVLDMYKECRKKDMAIIDEIDGV